MIGKENGVIADTAAEPAWGDEMIVAFADVAGVVMVVGVLVAASTGVTDVLIRVGDASGDGPEPLPSEVLLRALRMNPLNSLRGWMPLRRLRTVLLALPLLLLEFPDPVGCGKTSLLRETCRREVDSRLVLLLSLR
jgi:hypothetical protein